MFNQLPDQFAGWNMLTRRAQERVERLMDLRDSRFAKVKARDIKRSALGDELQHEKAELNRLQVQSGRMTEELSERQEKQHQRVLQRQKQLSELQISGDGLLDQASQVGHILTALERWMMHLPRNSMLGTPVVSFADFDLSLRKKPSLADAKDKVRALLDERKLVEAAPLPAGEAKALISDEVDRLADLGKPSVHPVLSNGECIKWPLRFGDDIFATGLNDHQAGFAFSMWLQKDETKKRLLAQVDELADDRPSFSNDDRIKELDRLDREILNAERVECEVIYSEGDVSQIRKDCDPLAILGVELIDVEAPDLTGPELDAKYARWGDVV